MSNQPEQPRLVARIGRAHGLRGEVTVQLHTDDPSGRFVPGTEFPTEPAAAGPLVLRSVRVHQEVHLLGFDGIADRSAAEGLRGVRLLVPAGEAPADTASHSDDEAWYADDLRGFEVVDTDGLAHGTVSDLHLRPHQDLLEVSLNSGGSVLVPFVEQMVPEVDENARRVVIDPPAGLLDLAE